MSRLRLLFAAAVFLAAFLLFMVEPIAARQLLPVLGGSASVWITCLVFFQAALLIGYLYAHWLTRRQNLIGHILLLVLALAATTAWAFYSGVPQNGDRHPAATVFIALGEWVGLPFMVLAATSPLMQVWWARLETGTIPYRLYALSNLASLLALALYPSVVEPHLTLRQQRNLWTCGFAVFTLLAIQLTLKARSAVQTPVEAGDGDEPSAPMLQKVLWLLLPMGAAIQLCAITSYLTANVAAIPLLWVLPLGVYLLTIILAFQFRTVLPWGIIARVMVVLLGGLAYSLAQMNAGWPLWLTLLFFLLELFFACTFCHSAAYALRPRRQSETTLFYLMFAAGGAVGSFLVGIAAPMAMSLNLDLPMAFFVTALLALAVNWDSGWNQRLLWGVASAAMMALVIMVGIAYQRDTTVIVRNFYSSLRVKVGHDYPGATVRTLLNGSIQHGTQIFGSDELRHTPTTYYATDSGVGLALRFCCLNQDQTQRPRNIAVIGLGAGTIAAYGRPGDRIRFFEINPAVEPIARNVFTYIRDSGASHIDIVPGDGRTSLARLAPQNFDVIVVDAFSGDAIPIHLLTREAMDLYRRHLAPGGILAFHISNQHVNLGPPIALLARSAGMEARLVSSISNKEPGEFSATWILVSDNEDFFARPELANHSIAPKLRPDLREWTDDYSALLPVLRW